MRLTIKYRPNELYHMVMPPFSAKVDWISKPPGVKTMAKDNQKPP